MSRILKVSESLQLSTSFTTKTAAILAQRRKGKTYAASVIAEELVAVRQPFVALDPTGAWWGLRASADGKAEGLPVVILGGQHGDVKLERTAGRVVADLVVDEPGYYVIDFSLFESGEAERQFAVDFAERLYRAKGQPGKDFALHLFVDEADRFVPQALRKGSNETSARLLGAFEALVRRGGLRGIGTTLISQRAAVVNKNVLEMLDILIALRTIGPNDRKAIDGYIEAHGTDAERRAMLDSLASLAIGEAWVWEPGAEPALFRRVQIRQRHTFNSSATPEPGRTRAEPRRLAAVDLEALNLRMADTIERAKADDPKELRKQLAEKDRRIRDLEHSQKAPPASGASAEAKPVLTAAELDLLRALREEWAEFRSAMAHRADAVLASIAERAKATIDAVAKSWTDDIEKRRQLFLQRLEQTRVQKVLDKIDQAKFTGSVIPGRPVSGPPASQPSGQVRTYQSAVSDPSRIEKARTGVARAPGDNGLQQIGKCERALLTAALSRLPKTSTKAQIAVLSGYSVSSSSFANALGRLRTLGYLTGSSAAIIPTPAGESTLGPFEPLPTGRALVDRWKGQLGKAEGAVLEVLADGRMLARPELADASGYSETSSSFANAVGKLRTLGLATKGWPIQAAKELWS